MSDTADFLCPEQIAQLQALCNCVAGPGKSYVVIEISNNHPRYFYPIAGVKAILPPEVEEYYANKKSAK